MNMSTLQTHRVGPSCFWCEEHLPLHLRASDSTISFYWRFWHSGALKRSIEAPLFSVAFFWKIVTRSDTYPTEKLTGTFLKGSLLIFGQLVALDAGRMRLEGAAAGSTSCRSTGWVDHDKTTGRCMWQRLWRSLTAVAMLMRSEYIGCRKCPLTCPSEPFSFVLRTLEIWWNIEHRPFTWSTHKFKPCIDSLLQKERVPHGDKCMFCIVVLFLPCSILWQSMMLIEGWKTCRFRWGLVYSASGFNKGKELLKSSFHLAPGHVWFPCGFYAAGSCIHKSARSRPLDILLFPK